MSRTIKIIVSEKDYQRILKEHRNVEEDIREFLSCSEYIETDREYAINKISSFKEGTIFSFRDVFENCPASLTVANGRLVRSVCKELNLAERYGYDSSLKLKLYRRTSNDVRNYEE